MPQDVLRALYCTVHIGRKTVRGEIKKHLKSKKKRILKDEQLNGSQKLVIKQNLDFRIKNLSFSYLASYSTVRVYVHWAHLLLINFK